MNLKLVSVSLVCVLLLAGIAYLYTGASSDKTVVGYRNHLMYLPVFVALENNLFEKNGMTVEAKSFEQTKDLLAALAASQVDASFGGVNLLDAALVAQRANSAKLLSVTELDGNHRISCLVSKTFNNASALSGKRVGHVAGAFGAAWAKAPFIFLAVNVSEFVPLSNELLLPSLEKGAVAAVFLIEPGCVKAESLGYNVVINEPIAAFFDAGYFTTSVVASNLPSEKVNSLEAVYNEAVDFIRANPQKSREILASYTGLKPELAHKVVLPKFLKTNEWKKARLNHSIVALQRHNLINGSIDLEQLAYAK